MGSLNTSSADLTSNVRILTSPLNAGMTCRYNKQESEFASKDEWDNYLEEREDISRILDLFLHPQLDECVQMVLRSIS